MHDFRLLPQCKWDLCSSGMLWSIGFVLCNIPEVWRSQILYARHKVENGNWQTTTCDLSICRNMHNIIVSIKGNVWLTSQCRKWKFFFWNMVQLLSIIPCFPASISPLLLLLLLVFSPWASLGRNQSPVRRPVWLWYAAPWAGSKG
jgi:hypothetical protein